jgi:hypothetical protein
MKHLGLLLAIAVLTACSSGVTVAVDGVPGEFCLPQEQTVPTPWWVPEDQPGTPRGFAFAGCWHRPDVKNCPFPSNIQGGTVHGLNHAARTSYGSIPSDAFLRTVLGEADTVFEIYGDGKVVTAHNPRLWQDWYVWELSHPQTSKSAIAFAASDKLLASCRRGKSVYAPIANGDGNIFCDRSFVAGGLSIHYSFEASEKVPRDIPSLDKAVLAAVRGWRCAA